MNQKHLWAATALAIACCAAPSLVRADAAECPNPERQIFIGQSTGRLDTTVRNRVTLVRVPFYGATIAAAIVDKYDGGRAPQYPDCLLYPVVDGSDMIFDGLPFWAAQLCIGAGNDDLVVYDGSSSSTNYSCRMPWTIYPFNYNGNALAIYGGAGADHIDGGAGRDDVFGGADNDNLNDGHDSGYPGYIGGDSGNDAIYGSAGAGTNMYGWTGADAFVDYGGANDTYHGEQDNDTCFYDKSGGFATMDCGPGTDTTMSTYSGRTNCERADNMCSINYLQVP